MYQSHFCFLARSLTMAVSFTTPQNEVDKGDGIEMQCDWCWTAWSRAAQLQSVGCSDSLLLQWLVKLAKLLLNHMLAQPFLLHSTVTDSLANNTISSAVKCPPIVWLYDWTVNRPHFYLMTEKDAKTWVLTTTRQEFSVTLKKKGTSCQIFTFISCIS